MLDERTAYLTLRQLLAGRRLCMLITERLQVYQAFGILSSLYLARKKCITTLEIELGREYFHTWGVLEKDRSILM